MEAHRQIKPINKYATRSKNVLLKPLHKKNIAKSMLSYREPHLGFTIDLFTISFTQIYLQ